ncbi:MAG: calcium-binding protein [Hellea sp.]
MKNLNLLDIAQSYDFNPLGTADSLTATIFDSFFNTPLDNQAELSKEAESVIIEDILAAQPDPEPLAASPTLNIPPQIRGYTEGSGPILMFDQGGTITDGDSNIQSMVIFESVLVSPDDILAATPFGAITASDIVYDAASGELRVTADASAADYTAVLRSVTWVNTGDNPTIYGQNGGRRLSVRVSDGTDTVQVNSNSQTIITAMNDAPELNSLETADLVYGEVSGPFDITSDLVVFDVDTANIRSATVTISSGFDAANDSLLFTDQSGISGSYANGVLTLTGSSSFANYQAALRSVQYENVFDTNSTATRTIDIEIMDQGLASNIVSRDIVFNIDETINGTAGGDTLRGGFGEDIINGAGGNDRLFGQDGDDTLNGGNGNDQLWGMAGADDIDGGAGVDGVYFISSTSAVTINGNAGLRGDAAGDSYTNVERFFLTNFDDEATGTTGNDSFYGLSGADTLIGGEGNDLLVGGLGDDMLFGGQGEDRILGSQGIDTVRAGSGNDQVFGGSGGDDLRGQAGNDRIFGGEGDDTILGGGDNDLLWGGIGADELDGGDGVDAVLYSQAAAGVTLDLSAGGTGGEAAGDTFANIENIYGSDFDDSLTGDSGNNIIIGRGGNDMLFGAGGADRLIGGIGNDVLDGGTGNDLLVGQSGADHYVFTGDNFGNDVISGWINDVETIELKDLTNTSSFDDLVFTQVRDVVTISFDEAGVTGSIKVTGADISDFDSDDFMFTQTVSTEMELEKALGDDYGIASSEIEEELFGVDSSYFDADILI